MGVLGLLLGVIFGSILGAFGGAPLPGMVLGGLIGWLLLRRNDEQVPPADDAGNAMPKPELTEIAQLRMLLENQQKRFERELAMVKQRLAALESGAPSVVAADEPAPEVAPAPVEAPAAVAEIVAPITNVVMPEVQPESILKTEEPLQVAEPAPAQPLPTQPAPRVLHEWKLEEAEPLPFRPMAPEGPNLVERAFTAAKDWLFGGNTLVRMGVVLVFIGLAFLLRYASDRVVIP